MIPANLEDSALHLGVENTVLQGLVKHAVRVEKWTPLSPEIKVQGSGFRTPLSPEIKVQGLGSTN